MILSLWVRVDLVVIVMKSYSTLTKSPVLEPQHQMQFILIHRILLLKESYPPGGDTISVF